MGINGVKANSYIESSASYVEESWAVGNDYFLGLEGIIYDLDANGNLIEKINKVLTI